ncbi:hypothetical protein B0H13DRAFT_1936708 [Mycena leptocephala]|nr:hypothetical protein B0H13DRAFT_1936708 [Mycena leptocephala]
MGVGSTDSIGEGSGILQNIISLNALLIARHLLGQSRFNIANTYTTNSAPIRSHLLPLRKIAQRTPLWHRHPRFSVSIYLPKERRRRSRNHIAWEVLQARTHRHVNGGKATTCLWFSRISPGGCRCCTPGTSGGSCDTSSTILDPQALPSLHGSGHRVPACPNQSSLQSRVSHGQSNNPYTYRVEYAPEVYILIPCTVRTVKFMVLKAFQERMGGDSRYIHRGRLGAGKRVAEQSWRSGHKDRHSHSTLLLDQRNVCHNIARILTRDIIRHTKTQHLNMLDIILGCLNGPAPFAPPIAQTIFLVHILSPALSALLAAMGRVKIRVIHLESISPQRRRMHHALNTEQIQVQSFREDFFLDNVFAVGLTGLLTWCFLDSVQIPSFTLLPGLHTTCPLLPRIYALDAFLVTRVAASNWQRRRTDMLSLTGLATLPRRELNHDAQLLQVEVGTLL